MATTGVLSVEELTAERTVESENESDSEADEDPVPSYAKAAEGFETFNRFMMAHKLEDTTLSKLSDVEHEMVLIQSRLNRKQTSLLDYFKKIVVVSNHKFL